MTASAPSTQVSQLASASFSVPNGYSKHTFVIAIILPILATAALALRFLSRRLRQLKYGLDDWLALASLVRCLCGMKSKHF